MSSGGTVSLAVRNGLDKSGGGLGVIALQAGGDLRNDDATLQVHGDAALQLGLLSNQKGVLSMAGGLLLDAQSLDNRGGELRHAGKAASSWRCRACSTTMAACWPPMPRSWRCAQARSAMQVAASNMPARVACSWIRAPGPAPVGV
ncbi:hypothetical protein [Stenotrophomonas maltophilia]|uniref:hypothetical protein n=1 Tax=Stenotrophomonas maltophilia TaxID=40324 RepID=UPI001E3DDD33|nr:hypothetical protein [Stenotrophomonas maltophilia]